VQTHHQQSSSLSTAAEHLLSTGGFKLARRQYSSRAGEPDKQLNMSAALHLTAISFVTGALACY